SEGRFARVHGRSADMRQSRRRMPLHRSLAGCARARASVCTMGCHAPSARARAGLRSASRVPAPTGRASPRREGRRVTAPSDARELDRLADSVALLRRRITEHEARFVDVLEPVAEEHRASALNLVHYLAVRQHDLRDLQRALHRRGLSSLGRMEAYVAATLDAV